DGFMNFTKNYGGDPNYVGTKLKPVRFLEKKSDVATTQQRTEITSAKTLDRVQVAGPTSAYTTVTEKDFDQATALWHIMAKQDGAQERFINNASAHVSGVTQEWLRKEVYGKSHRSLQLRDTNKLSKRCSGKSTLTWVRASRRLLRGRLRET